tara:strand:+ start:202 stop:792 length:591 start_codon:yes stop_codon:yes gene_type:complete
MRIFFIVLIFIFSLQSWTKADDITDFQIEGMSIGDSLLNYMNIEKINISKRNYFDDERKYYVVGISDNLNSYDVVDLYLKTGDNKYIIRTMGGILDLSGSKCFSKKEEIAKELENFFPNIKKEEFEKTHEYDKSNKSKQYQTVFFLKNTKKANDPHIRVECSVWSKEFKKKTGFSDTLNVVAMTTEILDWIYSGYK